MTQEVLKLALDALETELSIDWTNNDEFNASAEKMHKAIAAIKQALAQPEQEPVAWRMPNWSNLHGEYGYRDFDDPVCGIDGKPSPNNEPLYTHSQRTWAGLTDEERSELVTLHHGWNEYGQAIEAKLKELNDHGI